MKLLLCFFAASFAWGQVPTVSSIAVSNVTHNSVTLRFAVNSTTAWVSCELGTASGVYTAQTCNNYQVGSTVASFSLGGLAPSTAYFIRPTAQPNQTNTTNICNVNGCGATEQTFTTSADPALPVVPTAPTAYTPPNPDTSGYVLVRMVAGATSADECKAFASVGTVTAGDTVQTVLNEITLGYVLEFDQGITCPIPGTGANFHGYLLPHITTGSGYVVIRTKAVAASDFPPAGTRTSPTLCNKCATFKALHQFTSSGFTDGQIFYSFNPGGTQHFIVQNIILTVDQTVTSSASVGGCGVAPASCWGLLVSFGNGTSGGDANSDDNVFDRVVIRGSCNSAVSTYRGVSISAKRTAFINSYMDCLWATGATNQFAQGIFMDPGGTGPYTIDNNYIECVCMTAYQESDEGFANPANDITLTHNTLYWPASKMNLGYNARQQVEFKGGHRILVQGNLIDGCWTFQNECPAIYVAGTNNYITGDGISDFNANYNLIRNAATVFDCRGTNTADDGTPGPNPNISQRVWLQNTWAYNLGYIFSGAGGGGGGAVSSYIYHRPGCTDFTVDHNTFGWSNPQDLRTDGGHPFDYIPAVYVLGGGVTFAANLTHTNNIEYINSNVGANQYNGGRIFSDAPQTNASFPIAPAYTINISSGTNTPAQLLNTYSIHATNGSAAASVNWSGNVNICGKKDSNPPNAWVDLSSAECVTWGSSGGWPSTGGGDTWATGNTMAARESAVGFNHTTGICSGCGGAGANISTLYTTMELVTGINVAAASTSLGFSYTAPDTRACAVDVSQNSWATWTRTNDGGGGSPRLPVVSGLSPSITYSYRILCYFSQTSTLFTGAQITDGSISTTSGPALTCSPKTGLTPPNVLDIQYQTNMALGIIACTNPLGGACDATSVQRIVTAALGGACVTGP